MSLVVCHLSRDVIGYEDSLVRFDPSIGTVKRSSIVSQIVSSPAQEDHKSGQFKDLAEELEKSNGVGGIVNQKK